MLRFPHSAMLKQRGTVNMSPIRSDREPSHLGGPIQYAKGPPHRVTPRPGVTRAGGGGRRVGVRG